MPAGEMRQRGEDTLSQLSPSSSAGCLSRGRERRGGGGGGKGEWESADQSAGAMTAAGKPVGEAGTGWQGG